MTAAKPADIKKRQQQLRDLSQALKDEPVQVVKVPATFVDGEARTKWRS